MKGGFSKTITVNVQGFINCNIRSKDRLQIRATFARKGCTPRRVRYNQQSLPACSSGG
jgi:hypothetical protein